MPTATTASARAVLTQAGRAWAVSSWAPTTGSSQCCREPPTANRTPENTEPTASRIIGQVIRAGASCGWVPGAQRFSPKKVISITRVM